MMIPCKWTLVQGPLLFQDYFCLVFRMVSTEAFHSVVRYHTAHRAVCSFTGPSDIACRLNPCSMFSEVRAFTTIVILTWIMISIMTWAPLPSTKFFHPTFFHILSEYRADCILDKSVQSTAKKYVRAEQKSSNHKSDSLFATHHNLCFWREVGKK